VSERFHAHEGRFDPVPDPEEQRAENALPAEEREPEREPEEIPALRTAEESAEESRRSALRSRCSQTRRAP
jgi:hypothetical protein